ncbi:MAG: TolC family protein, partial [Pseudomonadota bacterium]|nr:TolC family protein [Pseudomonadota bacterium]
DAAGATLGIASARLYPQITLTADMMQEALTPAGLFKGASSAWSLAAGLSAPIFNGGTLHAEKREAEDAYQAALAQYQQTILFAFKQVADNLTALAHDEEETVLMNQALQMAKTSVRLAMVNYQAGASGLLNLQKKQRVLNQARLNQIRSINQQDLDCIRLFVSLGAGKD